MAASKGIFYCAETESAPHCSDQQAWVRHRIKRSNQANKNHITGCHFSLNLCPLSGAVCYEITQRNFDRHVWNLDMWKLCEKILNPAPCGHPDMTTKQAFCWDDDKILRSQLVWNFLVIKRLCFSASLTKGRVKTVSRSPLPGNSYTHCHSAHVQLLLNLPRYC